MNPLRKLRELDRKRVIVLAAVVIAVALLGAAVVLLSGGGGDEPEASDDDRDTTTSTTSTTAPTTTTTTVPPIAPLTGNPTDAAVLERPAIVVKIDNTGKALPVQEGVDRADVVVVEQVEGGVTRLAAVFHSQDAAPGPIRSARTSDIAISANFGKPLFTNSGGNGGVLAQVRRSPYLVDTGIDSAGAGAVFNRNKRGSGVLRFFVPLEQLREIREGQGTPPTPLFPFRPLGQPSAVGDPVGGAEVRYPGARVRYEWNGLAWTRIQDGRLHQMADGGPVIAPSNVIVMSTPYRSSGFVDVTGAPSPEAVLEGGGEALFLTDAKAIRGTWARQGADGKLTFRDGAGQPVALTPGQTFIELAPGPSFSTF
jgi:hypothetical protein